MTEPTISQETNSKVLDPSQFYKTLNFTNYFKRIVEWNKLARDGKHDFSEKAISFQKDVLVQEEFEELLEAYKTGDKKEALDALLDLFVVCSYWHFLQQEDPKFEPTLSILMPLSSIDYFIQLKYDINSIDNGLLATMDVCSLLYMFDGNVSGSMEEVLDSNDSKFPTKEFFTKGQKLKKADLEKILLEECNSIAEKSDGRYKGVTYKEVKSGKNIRYVFLSDEGKILKPSSFFSPDLSKFV